MNMRQREEALKSMIQWLSHSNELGKAPSKIEAAQEFDYNDMHYYIFKFKKGLFGDWLLGVCGGYEGDDLEHCGHILSHMQKYDEANALEQAISMIEQIKAYWIEQAKRQQIQEKFEENLKYISGTEIEPKTIEDQFTKSESRFFIKV